MAVETLWTATAGSGRWEALFEALARMGTREREELARCCSEEAREGLEGLLGPYEGREFTRVALKRANWGEMTLHATDGSQLEGNGGCFDWDQTPAQEPEIQRRLRGSIEGTGGSGILGLDSGEYAKLGDLEQEDR